MFSLNHIIHEVHEESEQRPFSNVRGLVVEKTLKIEGLNRLVGIPVDDPQEITFNSREISFLVEGNEVRDVGGHEKIVLYPW